MTSRRDFLAATLAAASLAALPAHAARKPQARQPGAMLEILVLGGTGFLGPHFVEAARAKGHKLTLFNRGKTNPERFAGDQYDDIEQLQGDRKTDMKALENKRKWDAVLETSAYIPADVARSTKLLGDRCGQYLLVSTISVYAKMDTPNQDESAPLAQLADPNVTEVTGETYGGLKALCEAAALKQMPGKVTVVRPGLIVGPRDPTGRHTHWPTRLAGGGEVIGPGDGATPVQWIDGRDLAAFLIALIEAKAMGVFNALGPERRVTIKEALDQTNSAVGGKATITWVDAAFLEQEGVSPWSDLPMWIPNEGDMAGAGTMSNARAVAAGLTFRPIADTARDTLAWLEHLDPEEFPVDKRDKVRSSGITRERELAVLATYHAKKK